MPTKEEEEDRQGLPVKGQGARGRMVFVLEPGHLRKLMNEALDQSNKAWVPNQPQDSQPSMSETPTHPLSPIDHSMSEMDAEGSLGGEDMSDEGADSYRSSGFRKTWTFEEDDLLSRLVQKYGPREWAQIAEHFKGRSAKQCHQRWHYCLDPKINRGGWTGSEDRLILKYQRLHGNRWSKIAKLMRGRTGYAVRNRYNCIIKQGKRTGKKHERTEETDTESNSGESYVNSDFDNNNNKESGKRRATPEARSTSEFSPYTGMAGIASHIRLKPLPSQPGYVDLCGKTSQPKVSEIDPPHYPGRCPPEMAASLLQLQHNTGNNIRSSSAALLALSKMDSSSHGQNGFRSSAESDYYNSQAAHVKPSFSRRESNQPYSPTSSSSSLPSLVACTSPSHGVFSGCNTSYVGSYDTRTYTHTQPPPSSSSSYWTGCAHPYPVTRPTSVSPPPPARSPSSNANLLSLLTKMAKAVNS